MQKNEGNSFKDGTGRFYSRDQQFASYSYYNCIFRRCNGRLKVYHDTLQTPKVMKVHTCSLHDSANEFVERELRTEIIRMSTAREYEHLSHAELLLVICGKYHSLPINTQKTTWLKCIANARYRKSQSNSASGNSKDADLKMNGECV